MCKFWIPHPQSFTLIGWISLTQAIRTTHRQSNPHLFALIPSFIYLFGPIIKLTVGPSVLGFALSTANAQVRPDTTLSTTVTSTDNLNFVIEGGDRPSARSQNGPNLFHSFETFSVPEGGSAHFNNPSDITHIIGRITGSQPSILNGLISARGEANLFLINPQGILFGPNAELGIGGSFLATTADRMVFQDGTVFSASAPSSPLLTVSVPVGLQMGANPQPIHYQSQVTLNDVPVGLMVDTKETIGLVGGAIALDDGHITTNNGRVELGGLGANQTADLALARTGYTLNYDTVTEFSDILLTNASTLDSSGTRSGAVQIQGAVVHITNGSRIEANTLGPGRGNGRAIAIVADHLQVDNQGSIVTETRGNGDGGPIRLTATDSILLTGQGYEQFITDVLEFILKAEPDSNAIYTISNSNGNAGNVSIKTPTLVLIEGGSIGSSTNRLGDSGDLILNIADRLEAHSSSLATSAVFNSEGDSGNIQIKTPHLIVKDGQQISSTAFGTGDSGNITIISNAVTMSDDRTQFPDIPDIIATDPLVQAVLLTSINSATVDVGNAGTLTIQSDTLSLQGGSLITTATLGQANGGDIFLDTGHLSISGNTLQPNIIIRTGISAATLDAGNAGGVVINAHRVNLSDGNTIDSSSFDTGDAGNVQIFASENITVQGRTPVTRSTASQPSSISSSVSLPRSETQRMSIEPQELGNAGTIQLTSPVINLVDGGTISISAGGRGRIGGLAIATHTLNLNGGKIVAESNMGQGGISSWMLQRQSYYKIIVFYLAVQGYPPMDKAMAELLLSIPQFCWVLAIVILLRMRLKGRGAGLKLLLVDYLD